MARLYSHAIVGGGSSAILIDSASARRAAKRRFAARCEAFRSGPVFPLVHVEVACEDDRAMLSVSQSRYLPYGVPRRRACALERSMWHALRHGAETVRSVVLNQREAFGSKAVVTMVSGRNREGAWYYRFETSTADMNRLAARSPHLSAQSKSSAKSLHERSRAARGPNGSARRDAASGQIPNAAGFATALFAPLEWMSGEELADDTATSVLDA